jgi:hypothetical protein
MRSRPFIALVLVAAAATGCNSKKEPTTEDIAAAASAALDAPKVNEAEAKEAARRRKWAPPSGPMLAVIAGEGVGPIRLGATVGTIERLMDKPCEVLTEELCRYVSRGVDFHLLGGLTDWIHVQRAGRPAGVTFEGEAVEFGFFNGAIPPDIRLGMVPKAVQQYLGPPERIENYAQPNPASMVAVDYYPGMAIEYDRFTNGKIIMGGIRIMKDPLGRPGYRFVPPQPPEPTAAAEAPTEPAKAEPTKTRPGKTRPAKEVVR